MKIDCDLYSVCDDYMARPANSKEQVLEKSAKSGLDDL